MLMGIKGRVMYNTSMNSKSDIEILPEDRVKLTNDQKNLIVLALEKQLPVEDAEFLEEVQANAKNLEDPFEKINKYFMNKYGSVFAKIYFSAITGGEVACKQTIRDIEESNALERLKRKI